ncbi:protein of unknown function [Candidatus Hydrogenisulfobacillus filiaventi]|uniref:Uncharacterized protein n=1 Tax=Candidatus Hydrogenisulfobacillus filiaventi TaxID=2707344 RepID=A0A6F8ZGX8_9FIRM|nr:hypothetical protein [Bacillota bacterium]CAB1128896.1 protein of unknown function [Candidatus Hydrogenisulfobacillus filiaventi]
MLRAIGVYLSLVYLALGTVLAVHLGTAARTLGVPWWSGALLVLFVYGLAVVLYRQVGCARPVARP